MDIALLLHDNRVYSVLIYNNLMLVSTTLERGVNMVDTDRMQVCARNSSSAASQVAYHVLHISHTAQSGSTALDARGISRPP